MKKLIAMSVLFGVASAGMLSAAPISAQTVIPFINGNLGLKVDRVSGITVIQGMSTSNFLTPRGTVTINQFNGEILSISDETSATRSVSANTLSSNLYIYSTDDLVVFRGTTSGSAAFSPTFNFTNAVTNLRTDNIKALTAGIISVPIMDGQIILTPPSSPPSSLPSDYLPISDNLSISYSTLPSSASRDPQSAQTPTNSFASSALEGGRVLLLENK